MRQRCCIDAPDPPFPLLRNRARVGGISLQAPAMEPGRPWLRTADRLAVALLVAGCGVGLAGLLLRPPLPNHLPLTPEEQQQRVRELENRLLEQVPRAVELRYRDL